MLVPTPALSESEREWERAPSDRLRIRLLREGLRKKRETRPDGRAGMCPRRRLATENAGRTMCRPYAPTGAVSHDDDDDE